MRCGILRASPAAPALLLLRPPALLSVDVGGCWAAIYRPLKRSGRGVTGAHARSLLCANHVALPLHPQRPRPPPSPRRSPQTSCPCSRGADFYKSKGIKKKKHLVVFNFSYEFLAALTLISLLLLNLQFIIITTLMITIIMFLFFRGMIWGRSYTYN